MPLWWEFHAKPVHFFNIFSGDPHFDELILGPYCISLIIGRTLGECTT